jgi:hypothetical protein
VDEIDPWKLKLALADLDQALSKKGAMIGALLIVGGPDVVPFHKLPNPTDDMDREVYSDNHTRRWMGIIMCPNGR